MKLVEILARELAEWPDDRAYSVGQAIDGTLHLDDVNDDFIRHTVTAYSQPEPGSFYDGDVTRADWEAERARLYLPPPAQPAEPQEAKWIRHRGGKCPVPKGTLVDVRYRNGGTSSNQPALEQGKSTESWAEDWGHSGSLADIMAYRLAEPVSQESEAGKFCKGENCNATKDDFAHSEECIKEHEESYSAGSKTDQIEGPLKWRDRIQELDSEVAELNTAHKAAVEVREEERVSLVQRLEDEGLALIGRKVEPAEDMGDWRNWKAGDKVELTGSDNKYWTKLRHLIGTVKDDEGSTYLEYSGGDKWYLDDNCTFKFHSRP